MIQFMLDFFTSFFQNPTGWWIGLALAFGAVWLAPFVPLPKHTGLRVPTLTGVLLLVFASSAFLALAAVTFIQIPLQLWIGQALGHFWSQESLASWILLAGIPQILLSGLVQEAAKLVAPLIYIKWRRPKEARTAIVIGAIAGAGFGIFEAQWALGTIFASGWTWGWVQAYGFQALLAFWERFFVVPLHIGLTAIAVYGLYKGKWWQFYLLAAFIHGFTNYSAVLLRGGYLTPLQVEIYLAVIALATVATALWLRWRPERQQPTPTFGEAEEEPAQSGL
jgi:hypothetical protein